MITLTHFGTGKRIALNVDLIEKVEETPDTVITLTNGTRYLVAETLDQIVEKSIDVRARAIHLAHHLDSPTDGQRLRLVHNTSDASREPAGGDPGLDGRP